MKKHPLFSDPALSSKISLFCNLWKTRLKWWFWYCCSADWKSWVACIQDLGIHMPVEALSLPCYRNLPWRHWSCSRNARIPRSRPDTVIWSLPFCAVDRIGFSVRPLPLTTMSPLPEKCFERQSKLGCSVFGDNHKEWCWNSTIPCVWYARLADIISLHICSPN